MQFSSNKPINPALNFPTIMVGASVYPRLPILDHQKNFYHSERIYLQYSTSFHRSVFTAVKGMPTVLQNLGCMSILVQATSRRIWGSWGYD